MLLHHIVSFFLVYISYTWGAFRIGAVILLLHDLADPFMELAKCFLYAGKQLMADILFATFAAVFIFTRNYIFPLYVITSVEYSARNELGEYLPSYAVNRACLVSLGVLEVLHIYWAVLVNSISIFIFLFFRLRNLYIKLSSPVKSKVIFVIRMINILERSKYVV